VTEGVLRIAHAHDAKVNDVLKAVLAVGLRDLLLGCGERVDGLVLQAFVPVSLHAVNRVRRGATWMGRWSCRCRSASRTRRAGSG
jgi:hypothetical protein